MEEFKSSRQNPETQEKVSLSDTLAKLDKNPQSTEEQEPPMESSNNQDSQPNPDSTTETKTESAPETKTESAPETKTESKTEQKTQPKLVKIKEKDSENETNIQCKTIEKTEIGKCEDVSIVISK